MREDAEKRGHSGGYTLVELAVVMAVLGILIAVSIPSAKSLIDAYRIRRLDMRAQTLFLAAQSRLSELRVEGKLDKLFALSEAETETAGVYYAAFSNPASGAEVAVRNGAANFKPILDIICPAFLFDDDLKAGCFAIEYDPMCGSVLSVCCSEGSFDYNLSEHESVAAKARTEDWERWRKEKLIGFCARGLETGAEPPALEGSIIAELTVVNSEELLLYVTGRAVLKKGEFADYGPESWSFAYTVAGLESGASYTVESLNASSLPYFKSINGGDGSVSYVAYLDSPEQGRSFVELYPGLEPGEDIAVSAELAYKGREAELRLRRCRAAAVNSLYYSKEGGAGSKCFVSNSRHIMNETINPLWEFIDLSLPSEP